VATQGPHWPAAVQVENDHSAIDESSQYRIFPGLQTMPAAQTGAVIGGIITGGGLQLVAVQESSLDRSFSGVQVSAPQPFIRPGLGRAAPVLSALIKQVLPLIV
jgi:hypothetical protein